MKRKNTKIYCKTCRARRSMKQIKEGEYICNRCGAMSKLIKGEIDGIRLARIY